MNLKQIIIISVAAFLFAGCGSGLLTKPTYKPVNFENYRSVELWNSTNQYQMATILQNYGKLEISFGNNGTIVPDTKIGITNFTGYGLSMVLEINNKGKEGIIVDLSNSYIKDDKGKIWKIVKCTEQVETNRQTSSIKLVPRNSNNPHITELYTNNYLKDHSEYSILRCDANNQRYLFIYFASNYITPENLPESFTFNIHSGSGKSKTTSKFKFNKIDW